MSIRLLEIEEFNPEFVHFLTASWTGGDEVYRVSVNRKNWQVTCSCFGANRHSLYIDLLRPHRNHGCKHCRAVRDWCIDLIEALPDEQ
jgi:hypothetical protein